MTLTRSLVLHSIAFACICALSPSALAQAAADPLREAAQKAISTNPEVTARFNAFRAATDEIDVARGAYYPRVDLTGQVARTRDTFKDPPLGPNPGQTLSNTGLALNINQVLWDGLATRGEVRQLDHARMTRYFEFLDISEQTALEAVKAYQDVARFRRLTQLAEDNYVQHKHAFDQIQSRVRAGVGRGVDLEQAGARLALAESNLATEVANLHDVSERYRRVVGDAPAANAPKAGGLDRGLPGSSAQLLEQTGMRNAAVAASVENLRSVQEQASVRNSAFQPKLEARARAGAGKNFDGVEDQKREVTAGLYLNWNLFNGGSDRARVRQYANLVGQAADLRDKACRDARQTAAIAYNDVRKLSEQLPYLDRNVLAIEKARDAYRQQFDIGQRSLLDLLNAENELYTARRAFTNAEYDLGIAQARTQAAMTMLVTNLGLTRAGAGQEVPNVQSWQAGDDAAGRCPAVPTAVGGSSKDELNNRARSLGPTAPAPAATPAPAPAAAPAPAPAAAPAAATPAAAMATQRLNDWAAAWMSKDADRYLGFYADQFTPSRGNKTRWQTERRRLVNKPGPIDVRLENITTRSLTGDRVETTFDQTYTSSNFKDRMRKTLTWQRIGNDWFIVKESNR